MLSEFQYYPVGCGVWLKDAIEQRPCLGIKVKPGKSDQMLDKVPAGRVACRIFEVDKVLLTFLLFRFEGYSTTYFNVLDYHTFGDADWNSKTILESLEAGKKLVFVVVEGTTPIGEFESSPPKSYWSQIISMLKSSRPWTKYEWEEAFRKFSSRGIPVDDLWDATPKVIAINSYKDLDIYENIIRQSGGGRIVDALRNQQHREMIKSIWRSR